MFDKIVTSGVIFSDGMHNAFPTVCRFGGALYIAFRSGKGHLYFDGVIKLMRSCDEGKSWEFVRSFSAEEDLRDPRLLVIDGKLHLYSGMRYSGRSRSLRLETRHWISADGADFEEVPLKGVPSNTFFWGFALRNNSIVGTGYRCDGGIANCAASLYCSSDGRNWELFRELDIAGGNEVALDLDAAGTLHGIVRRDIPPFTPIAFSLAPEGDIQYRELPLAMQGIMLKCVGDGFLIAARRWDGAERRDLRCDYFRCTRSGELSLAGRLPSAGDCSYAACTELKDGKLLVIYYSSHNHWDKRDGMADPEHGLPADICFAIME